MTTTPEILTPDVRGVLAANTQLTPEQVRQITSIPDTATKHLQELRQNIEAGAPHLQEYLKRVQEAQKLLSARISAAPASQREELNNTAKRLQEIEQDIERESKILQTPQQASSSPETLKSRTEELANKMRAARTSNERIQVLMGWLDSLDDSWFTRTLFGASAGFLSLLQWIPGVSNAIEKLQNGQLVREVRSWMRAVLPESARGRVRNHANDPQDLQRLRTEYAAATASSNPTTRQSIEEYVKARMRAKHDRSPQFAYTISSLLENPGSTPQQQAELKKKAFSEKVNQERLAKEEREKLQMPLKMRYQQAIADALLNRARNARGSASVPDIGISESMSLEERGRKIGAWWEGKQSHNTAMHLYLHNGNVHEYDTDRWSVTHDHEIPTLTGMQTLLMNDPQQAARKLYEASTRQNVIGDSSICQNAKTSLVALSGLLRSPLRDIDAAWARAEGPETQKKAAEDAAVKKQAAETQATNKTAAVPPPTGGDGE